MFKGIGKRLLSIMLSLTIALAWLPSGTLTIYASEDTRTEVGKVVATSNISELLVYGGAYTRGDTKFTVTTGSPAYFNSNMSNGDWYRLIDGEWERYRENMFIEGEYMFECQIRIDDSYGLTHKLVSDLSVTVDGKIWNVSGISVSDDYSYIWVASGVYTVEAPAETPLMFLDNDDYDIRDLHVNQAFTPINLSNAVSGGKQPYTFSKTSGPKWINVLNNGLIVGTPNVESDATKLVVRVTDANGDYREITISVDPVYMDPNDRTKVSRVVATSNIKHLLVYGNAYTRGDTKFTVTTGLPAYFNANMSNGDWYKLIDDEWERYREPAFLEGIYRFECQIRIDEDAGRTNVLSDELTVMVDNKEWEVDPNIIIYDSYSYAYVCSDIYIIQKPEISELIFVDNENFDIKEAYVNQSIEPFSLVDAVSGGALPYTFSIQQGPEWLEISTDGTVSGTPTEVDSPGNAIIRVTDDVGNYKEITISVGKVYPDPEGRTKVSTIVGTSDIDVAYGAKVKKPTITITEGVQARFVISSSLGQWYVKTGDEWEEYTEEIFELGIYRFECRVAIDGDNGREYMLQDEMSITVDGNIWNTNDDLVKTNTSSSISVYSIEYEVNESKFGITVTTDGNGVAAASKVVAEKGEEIILEALPNQGFELAGWQVLPDIVVIENNKFIMPQSAVQVKAFFKPYIMKQPKDVSVKEGEIATFTIDNSGNTVSYLWQYRTSPEGEWQNAIGISGYYTHEISVNTTLDMNGYQYRCKVTDNNDNVVYSNVAILTVVKKEITAKVVKASDTSLKVSWNKVSGAKGYEVYRSTSIDGTYKKVYTATKGTTVSWTNTKLTNGTTYFYKVRSYKTVSSSKVYGEFSDVVGYAALKTPSVTAKRNSYDSIKLSWKAISKATGYEIYRSTSKSGTYELVKTVTDLSCVDTDLLSGKTYYYKVRAIKDCSTGLARSSYSTYKYAKTTLSTPKATVTNPDYKTVSLAWNAIAGVDMYQIYRASKKDGTYSLVGETSELIFNDVTVTLGKTYYYKVRGYRNNVDSSKAYSSFSSIVSKKVIIATPKVTVTNPSYDRNVLDWQDVAFVKEYQIYRATSSKGTYTKVATTLDSYYEDMNVTLGKTYYYKVRVVVDDDGVNKYSSYSSIVSKKVIIATPKVTVTNPDYTRNVLDWQDVAFVKEYQIYRATSSKGTYTKVATTLDSYYEDMNVTVNKTYYYKVRAVVEVDGVNKYSSYSSIVSKKVILPKPTNVVITRTVSSTATIMYDSVYGADGYEIYRATSKSGTYRKVKTTTELTYTNTGLASKTYYYKVRAYRVVNGTKQYSSYSSIITCVKP